MKTPYMKYILAAFLLAFTAQTLLAHDPLVDKPVDWYDDDSADIPAPDERTPSLIKDQIHTTLVLPMRRATRLSNNLRDLGGDRWRPAASVNALDEVLNSSWFTNRIGLFPMTPEEAARGCGAGDGPDRSGPWTVVSAKTEGVTAGFNIRDAKGDVYVIKFDPPGYLGLTSGPGAISGRIFHAAGYNVPEDDVVLFNRDRIVLGSDVRIREAGVKRAMTEEDLQKILDLVEKVESGEYLAIASKYLSGRPLGPFDYKGKRHDDPNDRIRHEERRELRGLRLFAAWLNHFDTKQHNTLDMYVEENGRRFVRHYLIDFASTLGVGARGPSEKYGMEYGFDGPQTLGRLLAFGLHEDDWRRIRRPDGLDEVGYFEADYFNPIGFKPLTPNTAFAQMTDRDGYWAAKIISAFRDDHLKAVCETAKYRNPRAAPYIARILAERRDIIAREWFTRVCPIDFFRVEGDELVATDLGVERGIWSAGETEYRVREWGVDENRNRIDGAEHPVTGDLRVSLGSGRGDHPFQAFEFQAKRGGESWSPPVTVYVSMRSSQIVAVDR